VTANTYQTAIRIGARPEDVFPYLTDPALITMWMGDWAALDPRPGGQFTVDINGVPVRGRYLTVDPPRRVVVSWGVAGSDVMPPASTTVEITLRRDGNETVLELRHTDLPPEQATSTKSAGNTS
jgi:uncharacterized protein YndB with AHSA1/START domain